MSTAALCTAFFLSGVSALLFEAAWFRLAGLAFGNSVWASSLVLTGFMAGLALGNALATRHGDRLARPLADNLEVEVKALDQGADDYLGKPVERGRLLVRVRRALLRAHLLRGAP